MRIFYNQQTGQVVGTVDGFGDHSVVGAIVPNNMQPDDIHHLDIQPGDPDEQLARDLMDPFHDLTTETIKFDSSAGRVRPLNAAELSAHKAQKTAQEHAQRDFQKKNPPRDIVAELDALSAQINELKANGVKPPKP